MDHEGYWCLDMTQTESTHHPAPPRTGSRIQDSVLRIRVSRSLVRRIGHERVGRESLSAAIRRLLESALSDGGPRAKK